MRSSWYFDKYQFESSPDLLRLIADELAALVPGDTEVLAGLELGGIPLATAISLTSGIPTAFVRKIRKDYGTCRIAEGADVSGRRVCIVEDVITTGGQVVASAEALREEGAIVDCVVCVIRRGDASQLSQSELRLHALFGIEDLEKFLNLPHASAGEPATGQQP
jgi:orotate phosphoribosyltransferase